MFEKASRLKLRFQSSQGSLTVEDLWDLPLTSRTGKVNLDDIAIEINSKLEKTSQTSFVRKETKADDVLKLKLEILKHIIEVKMTEAETAETAAINKQKKQRILELIEEKTDASLGQLSVDELKKLAESL